MFAATTTTYAPATRLLRLATLLRLAEGFRLPKYSALAGVEADVGAYVAAVYLWRVLWPGEPLPHGDALDMECAVIGRIDAELFPLDVEAIDEMLYNAADEDVHPLMLPIWPLTYGQPWEACGCRGLDAAITPLAAAAWPGLPTDEWMQGEATAGYEDAELYLLQRGLRWHDQEYLCDWSLIQGDLEALTPPLDGLAVAYKCLLRNADNPFFDQVPPFWWGEYGDDLGDGQPYSLAGINHYQRYWAEAGPEIAKLNTYREWYAQNPAARPGVLELLADIFMLEADEDFEEEDDDYANRADD